MPETIHTLANAERFKAHGSAQPGSHFVRDGTRELSFTRESVNVEKRTVTLGVSSEVPVDRGFFTEVLMHGKASVRLARLEQHGALLMDHDRTDQIGTVEDVTLDTTAKMLRVRVRLSQSARGTEILNDIADGIRKSVSVGYRIYNESIEDPNSKKPLYRVLDWEPLEVSLVSIPADTSVGVGRSATTPTTGENASTGNGPARSPVASAGAHFTTRSTNEFGVTTVDENTENRVNSTRDQPAAQTVQGIKTLLNIGEQYAAHGGRELAQKAIAENRSEQWLSSALVEHMAARQGAFETRTVQPSGGYDPALVNYSPLAALRQFLGIDKPGFEAEVSRETAKRTNSNRNGLLIPFEALSASVARTRATVLTTTGGAGTYNTQHLGTFVDLLRPASVMLTQGAEFLPGLVGDVELPALTGGTTGAWIGEGVDLTEQNPVTAPIIFKPKTVGTLVSVSRRALMNSVPSIEMMFMKDMAAQLAAALDKAAIQGTGTTQPLGIVGTTGIGTVVGTAIAWAGIQEFINDLISANALGGSLGFIAGPTARGLLAIRTKEASGTNGFLWDERNPDPARLPVGTGSVSGYPAMASPQIAASGLLFGNYNDVMIGNWGVLELSRDESTLFASGGVRLRALMDADVQLKHATSFSYAATVT